MLSGQPPLRQPMHPSERDARTIDLSQPVSLPVPSLCAPTPTTYEVMNAPAPAAPAAAPAVSYFYPQQQQHHQHQHQHQHQQQQHQQQQEFTAFNVAPSPFGSFSIPNSRPAGAPQHAPNHGVFDRQRALALLDSQTHSVSLPRPTGAIGASQPAAAPRAPPAAPPPQSAPPVAPRQAAHHHPTHHHSSEQHQQPAAAPPHLRPPTSTPPLPPCMCAAVTASAPPAIIDVSAAGAGQPPTPHRGCTGHDLVATVPAGTPTNLALPEAIPRVGEPLYPIASMDRSWPPSMTSMASSTGCVSDDNAAPA